MFGNEHKNFVYVLATVLDRGKQILNLWPLYTTMNSVKRTFRILLLLNIEY